MNSAKARRFQRRRLDHTIALRELRHSDPTYRAEHDRLESQERAVKRTSIHYKLHMRPVQDSLLTMPGYRDEVWHAKDTIIAAPGRRTPIPKF